MHVHAHTSRFGWPGDGGLGLRLIAAIREGRKTATCCPVALCTEEEIATTRATAGRLVTVVDKDGAPHCNVRVVEVFETPWGDPDPRVVRGEGFTEVAAWHRALERAWRDVLDARGVVLTDDTPLLVELFELAEDAPPA